MVYAYEIETLLYFHCFKVKAKVDSDKQKVQEQYANYLLILGHKTLFRKLLLVKQLRDCQRDLNHTHAQYNAVSDQLSKFTNRCNDRYSSIRQLTDVTLTSKDDFDQTISLT